MPQRSPLLGCCRGNAVILGDSILAPNKGSREEKKTPKGSDAQKVRFSSAQQNFATVRTGSESSEARGLEVRQGWKSMLCLVWELVRTVVPWALGHPKACSSSCLLLSSSHTIEVLLPKALPGAEMIRVGRW